MTSEQFLFLETSAQIIRLYNAGDFGRGIENDIERFREAGSSSFVFAEFDRVVGRLYRIIAESFDKIPNQDRPARFKELWGTAQSLLPFYLPGGPTFLSMLVTDLSEKYVDRLPTAREVANFVRAEERLARESFYIAGNKDMRATGRIADRSKCCVWDVMTCTSTPAPECRLKLTCIEERKTFLESVETLAFRKREESAWLNKNLDKIRSAYNLALLSIVGSKPGHFGDIVIFWEVPAGWFVLTRDKTFLELQRAHRPDLTIWTVRCRRTQVSSQCEVTNVTKGMSGVVELRNASATGVAAEAKTPIGNKGDKVLLQGGYFTSSRQGEIVRTPGKDAPLVYGVRLR